MPTVLFFTLLIVIGCSKSKGGSANNSLVGTWMDDRWESAYEEANSNIPEKVCLKKSNRWVGGAKIYRIHSTGVVEDCFPPLKPDKNWFCKPQENRIDMKTGLYTEKNCTARLIVHPNGKLGPETRTACGDGSAPHLLRVTEAGLERMYDVVASCDWR